MSKTDNNKQPRRYRQNPDVVKEKTERRKTFYLECGKLFAKYGYVGTSVAMMCRNISRSKAAIFCYAESKEEAFNDTVKYHEENFPLLSPIVIMLKLQQMLYNASQRYSKGALIYPTPTNKKKPWIYEEIVTDADWYIELTCYHLVDELNK